MSDSHHTSHHPYSGSHSNHSTARSLLGSPSNKKITLANQYAATQELKEWGSNFWVVISDPSSGHSFFANPHTGECKWEVPSGTFVLPPNPDGQWMEFFDETHGLPYFFHSGSNTSQWERPTGFVIPLTTIQEVNMGRPFGGPAGAKRTPRVSISSDGGNSAVGSDPDVSIISTGSAAGATAGGQANGSSPSGPSITFAEPSKADKRKSIQPPPPTQKPSIDQVLAYRRSISLGKSDLLATALASNLIGMGAPYGSNANANANTTAASARANAEAQLSRSSKDNGPSTKQRGGPDGAVQEASSPAHSVPSAASSGSITAHASSAPAASTSAPNAANAANAVHQVTIRKTLGPKLLSDEMEHIRDTPTPLSHFSPNGGSVRDSFASFIQGGSGSRWNNNNYPPPAGSSGAATSGVPERERDDSSSVSSAGTDFIQHIASGRLFGSSSGHNKTGSGASGAGFTVSGPGGSGIGAGAQGQPGSASASSASLRDSIASSFSRSSSAMGGFAPIAEENGTGITVKITRPSTSTDGASLASKSGRWTPDFGGSASSWRREIGGSAAAAGGSASASASMSDLHATLANGSQQGGTNGSGAGNASGTSSGRATPTLRERESLRNMRSPPTSARAAAAAQAHAYGPGPTPLPLMSNSSPTSDSELLAPPPPSMGPVVSGGGSGVGNASGTNSWETSHGSGSVQSHGAAQGQGSAFSSWRTNSNASAAGSNYISGRGSSVSPSSSHSLLHNGQSRSASGGGVGGLGRLGANSLNGGSTAASSYANGISLSSDLGGSASFDRDSIGHQSAQSHTNNHTYAGGIGNVPPPSPQPFKSPKLFGALRFKLRNQSSSPSASSHASDGGIQSGKLGRNSNSNSGGGESGGARSSAGVMHIADRSASKELTDDDLPPETPEEAYNRRRQRMNSGLGSTASSAASAPYAVPVRSGSLGASSVAGGVSPLPAPPGIASGMAGVGTGTGTGVGRSPAMATPGLAFSPNSPPSLGSDSSHQHGPAALSALPGSYGLGVGLHGDAAANGNGVGGGAEGLKREPFRPSGVTDVVLNSRHSHAAYGGGLGSTSSTLFSDSQHQQQAAPNGGRFGRERDPDVKAFDALLKGYAGTESQVLKGVVGRVKAAASSSAHSTGSSPASPASTTSPLARR
ncbi:hypothetical protein OC835_002711 [Tilletia horrida]|nr:hypothetical protein OC835_002711 [Tilletia horrida]